MGTSKDIKDITYTNGNQTPEGGKKHAKYIMAGALFVLVAAIAACNAGGEGQEVSVQQEGTEVAGTEVSTESKIQTLIETYYTYYAAGDMESLQTVAEPFSDHELAYMSFLSQYIESYQNMVYYTKPGLDNNSYMVNVYLEMKLEGVETLAPGLDFFYVSTREDGTLYIDNSYSEYNMKNNDNPLDMDVQNLIKEHEQSEDLTALLSETTERYQAAVAADAALYTMVNETIPAATTEWMESALQEQGTETAGTETVVPETEVSDSEVSETETPVPETEVPDSETTDSETSEPVEGAFAEGTVITIQEAVKVREGMGTDTDLVETLYSGEKVTVVMSYAEGWTKVEWDGKSGYIRTDLLQ